MVTCGCGRSVAPEVSLCQCGAFVDHFTVMPDGPDAGHSPGAPDLVDEPSEPLPAWITAFTQPRTTVTLPGGARVELVEGAPLELGRRSPDATVREALAPLDTVSRQHAVIALEAGDRLRVTHVGTTNPTYVNGAAVQPVAVVPLPVELQLGESVHIHVTREA